MDRLAFERIERVARVGRNRPNDVEDSISIHDLLEHLGSTPAEVAENLYAENCLGPPQNDCFCPVAQFLMNRTGRASSATANVCVIGDFGYNDEGFIETFIGREWTRTPKPVGELIDRFDRGEYQFLRDR